jgi:hypothetical protein
MVEEYKPGEIVPQSGVYRITRDPVHGDVPHEVTVIKGGGFQPAALPMPPKCWRNRTGIGQ